MPKRLKVASILRRFSSKEWGGIETAVLNSTLEFDSLGMETEILCTNPYAEFRSENIQGIKLKRFKYFYPYLFLSKKNKDELDKKGGNAFSFGLSAYLDDNDFDLIHSHTMGRLAKQACKCAKNKNIPFVVSFHGGNYDVPKSEFDGMSKPLKHTLGYGRLIEKFYGLNFDLVEKADGVICVGKNEYEKVLEKFPNKKVALIPNGVNFERFEAPVITGFKKTYNIPEDKKLLLCVSRIDYQKNQIALLDLTAALINRGDDIHCAIIGFPSSLDYLKQINDKIKELGIENSVTLIEGLPPDSDMLVSAFKESDIFVLPSVHEPFGIVVLEAWAAKLPVIASYVGGLKDLIIDGKTGYSFDNSNIDSMIAAYDNALNNKGAIISEAFSKVHGEYSWNTVAKRIKHFYQELINEKR